MFQLDTLILAVRVVAANVISEGEDKWMLDEGAGVRRVPDRVRERQAGTEGMSAYAI